MDDMSCALLLMFCFVFVLYHCVVMGSGDPQEVLEGVKVGPQLFPQNFYNIFTKQIQKFSQKILYFLKSEYHWP